MPGVIKVDTIQNSGGTEVLSFDSSGRVSMGNTIEIDMWKLSADFTSNNATITGWERQTFSGAGYAGTGMTHSSGVFTFPNTGLWKVEFNFRTNLVSTDTSGGALIRLSTDSGSNYTDIAGAFENRNSNSSCLTQALINVTNASTFRVLFETEALDSTSKISGHADRNDTNVVFHRITDSQ
jgi:hypothetical protein